MKKVYLFLLAISIFTVFFCSCIDNSKRAEWNQIKNSQDFARYFNFALKLKETKLRQEVIDSLEVYQPDDEFSYLVNTYKIDSFFVSDFRLPCLKGSLISISIDEKDIVTSDYHSLEHKNFTSLILEFNRNRYNLADFPEIEIKKINNKEYDVVKLGVSIYTSMLSDSLQRKTSWNTLLNTVNKTIAAFNKVKKERAREEFGKALKNLTEKESNIINKLVTELIFIHFRERWKAPPPNLPPVPESLPLNLKDSKSSQP